MSVPKKPFVPVEPSRHMPPNVYFLYGNDEFAISQRLREFEVDFPDPSSAEMNITHLDARSMTESELNTAVNAMPFLAPKRLIFLCDPSVKYIKPGERRKFEGFLEKVPETAKLVCYETIEPKEAPKHWLVKWVAKNNKLVQSQTFMLPRHREMTGWIVNETKSQSGEIEASAAAKLAEMVGTDTRQASQEIAKLLAFNNWDRPISLADVAAIGLVTSQESLFDFVDALASGNGRSAQHLLQRLLEEEDPFALWGMVVRQFRLLLQAREVLEEGGDKKRIATALGVHPFVAEKTAGQARGFKLPALEKIYHSLLVIDEGVKTSQLSLDLAMEMLVVELAE